MNAPYVNFRHIKESVGIEQVLADYGVRLRRIGSCLRGRCPLPTHSSKRSTESFIVHLAKEIWVCYSASCISARGGKASGDALDFVALVEGCSLREAGLKLKARYSVPDFRDQFARQAPDNGHAFFGAAKQGEMQVNKPLAFALAGIDPTHPYLKHRGISIATARHFGVGFFRGKGLMSGRIVVPIHDASGALVGYAGRAIDNPEPRYHFPKGFVKSAVLFNLHRVSSEWLILVEGFFDCLKVWQAGCENVVALMGSSLSQTQERLLSRFKQIVLFLDGDAAGHNGATTIACRLARSHAVRIVRIADGKQPDQLSSEDILALLGL